MARTFLLIAVAYAAAAPAAPTVDVVLAHHDEDLSWLAKEPVLNSPTTSIYLYNKGTPAKGAAQPPELAHGSMKVSTLPNLGRESHTYLSHIVAHYDHLADWTVFSQAGAPSFGYKGHRDGGGHLVAGHTFGEYLQPTADGARFVYTAAVQLAPAGSANALNHALRADYCINNGSIPTAGGECPTAAHGWSDWWELGWFQQYIGAKVTAQHGEDPLSFYRKYIDPEQPADEAITLQFSQGARFAVSREIIQRRPKADYVALLATLSKDVDPYSGYYMEWMWPALFVGRAGQRCALPELRPAVTHAVAMEALMSRFVPDFKALPVLHRKLSSGGGSMGTISPSPEPSPEPSPQPTTDPTDPTSPAPSSPASPGPSPSSSPAPSGSPTSTPSPPPPLLPTGGPEVKTVLVFTASGDVSDYTPAIVDALETLFADLAGVAKDKVTVTVTSASVVITVEIRSSGSAAPTVLSRLQATVGTTAGATAFLSTVPGITITVLSVDSLSTVEAVSTSSKKDDNTGAIVGGVLGGLAGLALLALGLFMYKRGQCPMNGSSKLAKVVVAPPDADEKRAAPTSTTLGSTPPPSGGDRLLDKLAAADAHAGGTAPPSTSASEAAPTPAPTPAPAAPSWEETPKGSAVLPPIAAGVAVDAPAAAPAPAPEVPTGGAAAPPAAAPAEAPAAAPVMSGGPLPPISGAKEEKEDKGPEKGHRSRAVMPE